LSLLIPDPESRGVALWQGKGTLAEVRKIPSILGVGQSFLAGRLTPVVLAEDEDALVYDCDSGRMRDSPEHAALAGQIAEVAARAEKWPLSFVMAQEVAAFKSDHGETFVLLGADASMLEVRRRDPFEERPDGSRRSRKEGEELSLNPPKATETFTAEARKAPPEIVSMGSVLVPVDEKRIGILDIDYQRLIVIGPRERSGEE